MGWMLLIWLLLLVALLTLVVGKTRGYGALTLAYFLGLSLFHVPGILAYIDPYWAPADIDTTWLGFRLTLIGMAAFIAGAIFSRWIGQRRGFHFHRRQATARGFGQLGWRLILAGILAQFVVLPISSYLPSFTAAVSAAATILIVGLWLRIYSAVAGRDPLRIVTTYAVLPLLPIGTLVTAGFIGYGVYWVLSIIAFHYVVARNRILFYLAAPVVVFAGLSLFVTYIGDRDSIREAVWKEQAGLGDRFERVSTLITGFELLDLSNPEHITALNGRLNQNFFVGAGVERLEAGIIDLQWGATVPLWGFIPRAMWPNKPAIGGGGDVVRDYTGLTLDMNTSWGAGQVLEFNANFGLPGVILGFFGFGVLLMWLDRRIMQALAAGNQRSLLLHAVPGLVLLRPEGNLIEIIVALVAAFIVARLVVLLERRRISTGTRPLRSRTVAP